MNRREALSRVAVIMGGAIVGAEFFLSGCKTGASTPGLPFSPETIALLDEIAETILPATTTPGAKEAKVGAFMAIMVKDCYDAANQKIFIEGITKLDEACNKAHGTDFMSATVAQRTELLNAIDKEAKAHRDAKKPEDPAHYFTLMKQLTLTGFFTSEVGATKALRYIAVPGKFEGSVPYKKGDKAWAT